VGQHRFTRDQVRDLRKVSVRTDFIEFDGFLNRKGVSGVAMVASGITGHNVYIKRVGVDDPFTHIIAVYERRLSNGDFVRHFVLAGLEHPDKVIQWDPWSKEGSRTGKEGYVVGFRHMWAERV